MRDRTLRDIKDKYIPTSRLENKIAT